MSRPEIPPSPLNKGGNVRGAVYICYGKPAIDDAEKSMASLWRYDKLPVLVVGDEQARAHYAGRERVTVITPKVQPFRGTEFMAGLVKPLLGKLSPWDWTLYIDADTEFRASPELAFGLLEKWDFVVAETETRSLINSIAGMKESAWTRDWLGTPHIAYHNSGMLFWRKNAATKRLFELWAEEWQRFQNWDEQVALLRALLRSEAVFLTVPHTWNCRQGQKAFLLHHRFGTRTARSGARPARERHRIPTPGPEFVIVELGPGRSVRCRPGQEEFMRQRLGKLHLPRSERRQK